MLEGKVDFVEYPNRYYKFYSGVLRGFFRIFLKVTVTGRDNFDKNESFIIVSNHNSWVDPLLLMAFLPRVKIATMAEETSALLGGYLKKVIELCNLNIVGIDRADQKSRLRGIKKAQKIVAKGDSFLIFPEGRFNRIDGKMHPFYMGAFLLAKRNNRKIIPIYIRGNEELYLGRKVTISIGQPLETLANDDLEKIATRTYKALDNDVKPEKPKNNGKIKLFDISKLFIGEMAEVVDDDQMVIRGNNAAEIFGKVNHTV